MYSSNPFTTSGLEAGGLLAPCSGLFTAGKGPVPIYSRLGGPHVWKRTENLVLTGIKSPYRPALGETTEYGNPATSSSSTRIRCRLT